MKFIKQLICNIKLIIKWIPRLWNTYDWDYGYLLDLERYKIGDMIKWYEENDFGSLESGQRVYKQLLLAYKLLTIYLDEEDWWYAYNHKTGKCTFHVYINTKNYKRFLPKVETMNWVTVIELRKQKAWYLYCELRKRYSLDWCD